MPYLGDYLGLLLSEISLARMHADLETVRLAELYAAHPLLRTMPVPHMRLPDVDLEIPLVIKKSEEPRDGESARGRASPSEMRRTFDEVFATTLAKAGVVLSAAERRKLAARLDARLLLYGVPPEISIDVNRTADDPTATALGVVEELRPRQDPATPAIPEPVSSGLKDTVRIEFLKIRTSPPRLTVLVTTAEVREAGTSEHLTRIRLKVSEQGVEWTSIESEGVFRDLLVPE